MRSFWKKSKIRYLENIKIIYLIYIKLQIMRKLSFSFKFTQEIIFFCQNKQCTFDIFYKFKIIRYLYLFNNVVYPQFSFFDFHTCPFLFFIFPFLLFYLRTSSVSTINAMILHQITMNTDEIIALMTHIHVCVHVCAYLQLVEQPGLRKRQDAHLLIPGYLCQCGCYQGRACRQESSQSRQQAT